MSYLKERSKNSWLKKCMIHGQKLQQEMVYAGDEVISALQKSIRRGLEEQACMFAYELYISSPQVRRKIMAKIINNISRRYWEWGIQWLLLL